MNMVPDKISLNLNADAEVSVKGFIAPIEYTQYDFHVRWDELANFRVAEPEKQYPHQGFFKLFFQKNSTQHPFFKLFFHRNRFQLVSAGRFKKRAR